MKLTDEQINDYSSNYKFELSTDELTEDWYIDKKFGFQTITTNLFPKRMINLKNKNNAWIRIPFEDLHQEQIESLLIEKEPIDEERLDKLAEEFSKDEPHSGRVYYGYINGYRDAMEG